MVRRKMVVRRLSEELSTSNSQEDPRQSQSQSKRPINHPFIQQNFPTTYPILNAGYIFPWFFFVSLCFMGFGAGIYIHSETIQEETFNYTECYSVDYPSIKCKDILNGELSRRGFRRYPLFLTNMSRSRSTYRQEDEDEEDNEPERSCTCDVTFTLDKDMNGTVYMYYALTNFYQNHLRYYTNRDENQLKGKVGNVTTGVLREPSSYCKPDHLRKDKDNKTILPCGMQANSMFNDEIELYDRNNGGNKAVPLNRMGIALQSDKNKFDNPPGLRNPKDPHWWLKNFAKPPAWRKHLWELDPDPDNNGIENEDFVIWMRTSAFSNFRKLYRIVNSDNEQYENGLPAGNYSFRIAYNFDTTTFEGEKLLILTNSRMTGGRNYFLASVYGVTGVILFVLFVVFLVIHFLTRNRHLEFKFD